MTPGDEQSRIAKWMAENGYPTPIDGPWRTPQQLAGLGASDWIMEEALIMEEEYLELLTAKAPVAIQRGYQGPLSLNPNLKPHARDIAKWMIRGGNRACFSSFGLHKTSIQLQIAESLLDINRDASALIVCPLGVRRVFRTETVDRGFKREPLYIATNEDFEHAYRDGHRLFLSNYERVRDGALDPNRFLISSLDEAAHLRSFGSLIYQNFLTLFEKVQYKFVATATPSPNRFKELIHYAGFLGVMDTGHALTRFFKRDPTKAGNLTIHPHKVREFRLWLNTWAVFCQRPSDLGYSDVGYDLPELDIIRHRLPVDHTTAGFDSWGQGKLLRNAALGVSDGAREKRDSLPARIERARKIIEAGGVGRKWIIWHDLEVEREAIETHIPGAETISGTGMSIEEREEIIERFCDGKIDIFGTKASLSGVGENFQYHCYSNILLGINFKFHDFIQLLHRTQRFGQKHKVELHLIYTESEDPIHEALMEKWENHKELHGAMSAIIKEFGLNNIKTGEEMCRSIGIERREVSGERFTLINNDSILELSGMEIDTEVPPSPVLLPSQERQIHADLGDNGYNNFRGGKLGGKRIKKRAGPPPLGDSSVDLIVTSWPFSDHYEYTESYSDFGHNDGDAGFFAQMDHLTPHIMRVLKPGRMYCVHAKDRIRYGSVTGLGMYSVNRFSDKCADHCEKHGFVFCGRITVTTDVVRENNQTYRLGFSENAKDGTKMGVGSPEYVLLFRKLPTDRSKSYADDPVIHPKPLIGGIDSGDQPLDVYSLAQWQFDAHAYWRSSGDRFLNPEEYCGLRNEDLRELWTRHSKSHVYDFHQHVAIAFELERRGLLPKEFMGLPTTNPGVAWVWDDIARMRTFNAEQARRGYEQHVCPLQTDIVERLIKRYSNHSDLVMDPFSGIGTVPTIAVRMGRHGFGIELSEEYFKYGASYCKAEEQAVMSPTLFDTIARPDL